MKQKLCNATITFGDGRSVVIESLVRSRRLSLSTVDSENGNRQYITKHGTPAVMQTASIGWRAWRRFNAWMMGGLLILFLALFLILPPSVTAQTLVKTLEPARVSFADDSSATVTDREFNELLRAEMNDRGTIRFTSSRFDYKVLTATAPITSKGKLQGYAVAVGVLTPGAESKELDLKLHVTVGPTLDALASDAVIFLDKELQRPRRRR